jgi:decaprenyl-phosphate phosphoribosyltransferase
MALSVFRYLMVIEQGEASAPEEVFATERAIQLYGLVWLIVYGLGIYAS